MIVGRMLDVMPSLKRFASGSLWNTLVADAVPRNVEVIVLERVRRGDAELGRDERIAERERAARRGLRELVVDLEAVEDVDRHVELRVEEVRLEEADVDELPEAGDL